MPSTLQQSKNFTTVVYETCLLQELSPCQNKACVSRSANTPRTHPNVLPKGILPVVTPDQK